MDIIERMEIKHFRSFDGGKDQTKIKIDNLKDFNIFSGANDSGKSNVLRALNLFFNDEIEPNVPFNKDRDFSKIVAQRFDSEIERRREEQAEKFIGKEMDENAERRRHLRRSDVVIAIKLFFNNAQGQRGLPPKFWISKSYSQKNNFEGEYINQGNLKDSAQVTLFLSSFQFEYVPAIKDRQFFNQLFEKLQTYLFEKEDKKRENKFASSSRNFNEALESETKELFSKFRDSSGVDANFHIPSTLVDFFRTLSVKTENDISLFDRGDGVQARFIPEILDEISKSGKKNIIWGFEEPENSYEVKNIRKIRDEFLTKYSRSKQIFITTHTQEFLSVKRRFTDGESAILQNPKITSNVKRETALRNLKAQDISSDVALYRVWKNRKTNNSSFVTRFDEKNRGWENTCDDLGIIEEARVIEDLQEKLSSQALLIEHSELSTSKQNKIRKELLSDLREALSENESVKQKIEEYEKPILVVEDKYDDIYKIAFLKLNGVPINLETYKAEFKDKCPFTIRRAEGAGSVSGLLRMNNTDGYEDKKIIGLFDFDEEGCRNFHCLKNGANWNNDTLGEISTGVFKKRKNHDHFYGLLLPIPDRHTNLVSDIKSGHLQSLVEIENLLKNETLEKNNLVDDCKVYNIKYQKIKSGVKKNLPKILLGFDAAEFEDFTPLFSKINELFEIP